MNAASCCSWEEMTSHRIEWLVRGLTHHGRLTRCSVSNNTLHLECEVETLEEMDSGRRVFDISPIPQVLGGGCGRITFAIPGKGVMTIL